MVILLIYNVNVKNNDLTNTTLAEIKNIIIKSNIIS